MSDSTRPVEQATAAPGEIRVSVNRPYSYDDDEPTGLLDLNPSTYAEAPVVPVEVYAEFKARRAAAQALVDAAAAKAAAEADEAYSEAQAALREIHGGPRIEMVMTSYSDQPVQRSGEWI